MAERKPATKSTQKSAKRTSANGKISKGFTAEEKAAMRERARELKAEATKADGEKELLAAIAKMEEPARAMAKKLHVLIKATAPALAPRGCRTPSPGSRPLASPLRWRHARSGRASRFCSSPSRPGWWSG